MALSSLMLPLLLAPPAPPPAAEIVRTVGQLTIVADPSFAFPGGVLVVRLRRSLGTTYAILHGRRVQFSDSARGPRALVPIPVTDPAGPTTLGIELLTRRGRQRIAMDVTIAPRGYAARTVTVPEAKRALVARPASVSDGRRLLLLLRTETSKALWAGPFLPPVGAPGANTFGDAESFVGASPVDATSDAIYGEYHRGIDYDAPAGTAVLAPAAGSVLFAGPLTLTGQTLVLDHGQGVVSVFFHLSRTDVRESDRVEARAPVALSGDTGIAAAAHLHWGVYVHGVAVDPGVFEKLKE